MLAKHSFPTGGFQCSTEYKQHLHWQTKKCEKCPKTEFFWSVSSFSHLDYAYGKVSTRKTLYLDNFNAVKVLVVNNFDNTIFMIDKARIRKVQIQFSLCVAVKLQVPGSIEFGRFCFRSVFLKLFA